jgi:hypothetical protein
MKELSVSQQKLTEPQHRRAIKRKGNAEFAGFDPSVLVVNVPVIEGQSGSRNGQTKEAENYKGA